MNKNFLRINNIILWSIVFIFSLDAQSLDKKTLIKDYQLSSEQYISGDDGKVYMNVNFWGTAGNAGTFRFMKG